MLFAYTAYAQRNNPTLFTYEKSASSTYSNGVIYKPLFPDVYDFRPKQVAKKYVGKFFMGRPLECFCAEWLKQTYGFNVGTITYAKNWPKNSQVPVEGGVTITSESFPGTDTGHVVYNQKLLPEGILTDEANLSSCQRTSRIVPYDYSKITGYWVNE